MRDVHPAEVVVSDGTVLTGVRVFLTTERLQVWRADAHREMSLVLDLPVCFTEAKPSRNTLQQGERLEVFSDEATVVVNKGKGCGCHSPLKALGTPVAWVQ